MHTSTVKILIRYKNQRAYFDIPVGNIKERPLKLLAVLPLCPNKLSVFIKFRPDCPWAQPIGPHASGSELQ